MLNSINFGNFLNIVEIWRVKLPNSTIFSIYNSDSTYIIILLIFNLENT